MKIAVLGAGGRSGKIFVERALEEGHSVIAGVRNQHSFQSHPNLMIRRCDASDAQQVFELLKDSEAVVSLIGHVKKSPPDIQTVAIQNVISVMNTTHKRRLISLTGTGVRMPNDSITLYDHCANWGVQLIDPARIRDGRTHVQLLQASSLDWTVLRVLRLQNHLSSDYTLRENGPTKMSTSRYEVADAIIDLLENRSFIGKAPIISRARQ